MKIIKTALGWEIQPQTSDEESHIKWLLDGLATRPVIPVVVDENVPVGMFVTSEMLQRAAQAITCPRCFNYNCYNNLACSWCGYRSVSPPTEAGEIRTFTTKGPVE